MPYFKIFFKVCDFVAKSPYSDVTSPTKKRVSRCINNIQYKNCRSLKTGGGRDQSRYINDNLRSSCLYINLCCVPLIYPTIITIASYSYLLCV